MRALIYLCVFLLGALLSWLITADFYGKIITKEYLFGLPCKMYGLDTVTTGKIFERESFCVDLPELVPEQVYRDKLMVEIKNNWYKVAGEN